MTQTQNAVLLPENLEIDFAFEDERWTPEHEADIKKAVLAGFLSQCAQVSAPVEISVLLTNDAGQQALNKQWRNQDKPTNVLSFPQIEPFSAPIGLIGDVSFAFETLHREAQALQIDIADHLIHLALHGFLHILGYDHISEQEAIQMERLETQILEKLGIANPYQDARSAKTV